MKLLGAFLLLVGLAVVHGGQRLCYYTNWSQYRQGDGRYTAYDIDPTLCDVIVYCFATMEYNELLPLEWNDPAMYAIVNGYKATNPNLKTVISLGGKNLGLQKMIAMLATQAKRSEFIQSSIDFMNRYSFDGVEYAFEHPGSNGSPLEDKERYALFFEEFREKIKDTGKLLTVGSPPLQHFIVNGYDIPRLTKVVDWFSVRTIDFNGHWQVKTGIGSALFPRSDEIGGNEHFNLEWTMDFYNKSGADNEKLIVGIPAYARGWTLADRNDNAVGAPGSGASKPWEHTKFAGVMAYYEVCHAKTLFADYNRMFHDEHKSPYATFNNDQWIGYDDIANIKLKVNWIKAQGYGGFMLWSLDYDDFKGKYCHGGKHPLLKAASDAMQADN